MNSENDKYLLDLFRQSGEWSNTDVDILNYVYIRYSKENEDLVQMLIRVKVFQRSAVQVLQMMKSGQIKPAHLSFLFQSNGPSLLKHSLKVESERRIVRQNEGRDNVHSSSISDFNLDSSGRFASPTVTPKTSAGSLAASYQQMNHNGMNQNGMNQNGMNQNGMNQNGMNQNGMNQSGINQSAIIMNPNRVISRGDSPRVGMVLGKVLLTSLLGQGGNGKVFSGLHQTLNMQVAVKVLNSDGDLTPEQIAKLSREAQLLARLSHPNVIRVIDYDDSPIPYVLMEYVEGLSLADLIDQTGGLRVPRAADIIVQVAHGLAAAWEVGLIHRDIKPGNILITKQGSAKVTDLGLAMNVDSASGPPIGGALTGTPLGTCGYMSPEQAVNDPDIDFRTDIYSLGATFYHAVTGRMPFVSKSTRQILLMHMKQAVEPPHLVSPGVCDERTSEVICRMMEKSPNDRYSSYNELIADLAPLAQQAKNNAPMNTPNNSNETPIEATGKSKSKEQSSNKEETSMV